MKRGLKGSGLGRIKGAKNIVPTNVSKFIKYLVADKSREARILFDDLSEDGKFEALKSIAKLSMPSNS